MLAVAALVCAGLVVLALRRRGRSHPEYESLLEVTTAAWDDRVARESAATLEGRFEQDFAIYVDPRKLSGILTALLENAVDHGPADGTVRIERTDDGFYVADEGPGIPESERERVFGLGYSTLPDHDGLGPGLVRSVCESHDWTVRVTDSDSGGAKVLIENVDVLTDWERDATTDPDFDDDRDAAAADPSYITGEVSDQSDHGSRERAPTDRL